MERKKDINDWLAFANNEGATYHQLVNHLLPNTQVLLKQIMEIAETKKQQLQQPQ